MKKNFRFELPLFCILIGIAAFALIMWVTPHGAGVSPDSTIYINAVKSLLSGKGFSVDGNPITHYPPLYPLFLAATSILQSDIIQAARLLNAILFGINASLIALAVYLAAGRNFWVSACAACFFLVSAPLIELHSYAWSEPLFMAFSLASLILLAMYVAKPTVLLFIASSTALGGALLTRYIGIAFLPAASAMVFVGGDRQLKYKIRDTVIWLVLACAPLGILLARNVAEAGSSTNRSFIFHPMSGLYYSARILDILSYFIAPVSFPAWISPAFFGLGVIVFFTQLLILFKWHSRNINWRSLEAVLSVSCFLFSISYVVFLYTSICFFDASTPIDMRLLAPVLIILIAAFFSAAWVTAQALKTKMPWRNFILIICISIAIKIPNAIQSAAIIQKNGLMYTSRQWQESETVAFVRSLPESAMIYSNAPDAVGFLTQRKSALIPEKISPLTMKANNHYSEELMSMCKNIRDNEAVAVYFNQIDWKWFLPTSSEVESTCQTIILQRFGDGIVYTEKQR